MNLGESQKSVYDFIGKFIKDNGYAPTIREIGAAVYLHASVVHHHLHALKAKGMINFVPNAQRTITVTKAAIA